MEETHPKIPKWLIFTLIGLLIATIAVGVGGYFLGLTQTTSKLPVGLRRAVSTEASYPYFIQKGRNESRIVQEFIGKLIDQQGNTWTIESNIESKNVKLSLTNEQWQNSLIEPKYYLQPASGSAKPPQAVSEDQIKIGQNVRITTVTRIDSGTRQIISIIIE